MRKLLLQLTEDPDLARWLFFDQKGDAQPYLEEGTLEEAIIAAKGTEVYVLVPSTHMLFTQIKMPQNLSAHQLEKAIPFALEDKLITNVDDHHFLIGKAGEDENIPVVVVSHEHMNKWLQLLSDKGIKSTVMIPNLYAIPLEEDVWFGYEENQMITIRTGIHQGFSIGSQNFSKLLALRLQEDNEIKPKKVIVSIASSEGAMLHDEKLPLSVETHSLPRDDLVHFVKQLDNIDHLNLLTGRYERTTPVQRIWTLGFVGLGLALLWLSIKAGGSIGLYYALTQQQEVLKEEISVLYKKAYPNAKTVVSPKERLEQELKQVEQHGGGNVFFQLLSKLESVLLGSDVDIKRLSYDKERVTLNLEAPTFMLLEKFVSDLRAIQLEVDQENATSRGGVVVAQLTIETGVAS